MWAIDLSLTSWVIGWRLTTFVSFEFDPLLSVGGGMVMFGASGMLPADGIGIDDVALGAERLPSWRAETGDSMDLTSVSADEMACAGPASRLLVIALPGSTVSAAGPPLGLRWSAPAA